VNSGADFKVRLFQQGDEDKIVKLLVKTFKRWEKYSDPLKIWRWKYVDDPKARGFNCVVVLIGDKIVGCNHSIIYRAKVAGEMVSISWNDELAVDADYRGQGIWNKIRAFKEDYEKNTGAFSKYDYNTSVNPIVFNSWEKRERPLFTYNVTRMVRIKDIDLHLRMRPAKNEQVMKIGFSGLKAINQVTRRLSSASREGLDVKIVEVSSFDEGVDRFWDVVSSDYGFILEKKRDFLNWRYQDNERGTHRKLLAVVGDEVVGFAVLRATEEDSYREGYISELLALRDRSDVVDSLFNYACEFFDERGFNCVYYQVVEDHVYRVNSEKWGFVNSKSSPNILFNFSVKNPDNKQSIFDDVPASNIYFSYGETV
jgi:GNAT superfamily N-acetyltransferase